MNRHGIQAAPGDAHAEAQEALPWLANGSLAGTERERVEAHLHACAQCRADLAVLHTLRAAAPGETPDWDPERALARLLPRLDAPAGGPATAPAPLPPARGWRARLAANDARWLRLAVGAQCCAIVLLAALLARAPDGNDRAGEYRVLGAGEAAQGRLVVAFRPDTPERELRRIVQDSGARIVGGPTVAGAWMLDTGQDPAALAARLRAEPAVTLAEPLGAQGRP